MLADRADEIGRKLLSLVDIAADAAAPDGFPLFGGIGRLRLRFDVGLVVGVCGGRSLA